MFYSIMFPTEERHGKPANSAEPDCFKDLNLNRIFDPILKGKKGFELETFFYTPLRDTETIVWRQEVLRDLEDDGLRALINGFSETVHDIKKYMDTARRVLDSVPKGQNDYLTCGRVLDYAERYCSAVSALSAALSSFAPRSAGLLRFSEYLGGYCASESYAGLCDRVKRLREGFSGVEYCMLIKGGTIRVRKYEGQTDHAEQILASFEKFRQGEVKDYRQEMPERPHAAHVEAAVLDMVAGLYKEIFADLKDFCAKYLNFDEETILRFSREVQFYLAWLDFLAPLRVAGLPFCYPKVCGAAERLYAYDGFDLALACAERGRTVVNDFTLDMPERIIVVTGPNQGGKTTFARAFGQMHYLAAVGLCVPGRDAALYLFDNIFTHFSREEDLSTLNGKLQDDLVRLRALFDEATSDSVIIVNEIFASTTLSDALMLGGHMMDRIAALGVPAVVVTFLDELATRGAETVSMMSNVMADDPATRTFKIVRKPPDGLAYAIHIAGRHGLTYKQLCGRLKK